MMELKKLSLASLAIKLEALQGFEKPNPKTEQYRTESTIAATMLWHAYLNNNLANQKVVDFGCGTGILGIGALLLGAKQCLFVDYDASALAILKKNLETTKCTRKAKIIQYEIKQYPEENKELEQLLVAYKPYLLVQNPPFGTKKKHADLSFLLLGFLHTKVIYSIHKTSTLHFLEKKAKEQGWHIQEIVHHNYPLKPTMQYHKKNKKIIKTSMIVFKKLP
ncbi:MAG: METTL5 family protein [Candidatus Woesearchaeota archaeon]